MFEAIDKKLIPGFPTNLRVLLLSQVEDSARAAAAATEGNLSVLEHVVRGDKERMKAVHEYEGAFGVESELAEEAHVLNLVTVGMYSSYTSGGKHFHFGDSNDRVSYQAGEEEGRAAGGADDCE